MIDAALGQVAKAGTLAELDEIRVHWLGKKGQLTLQLQTLGRLAAAARPAAGARINAAKSQLQEAIDARRAQLERLEVERALSAGRLDVTLPGRGEALGGLHPITLTRLR